MKKFLVICLFSFVLHAQNQPEIHCDGALQKFVAADYHDTNHDLMHEMYASLNVGYKKMVSMINADIIRCRRYINRHLHGDVAVEQYHLLIEQMRSMVRYVKQHKHCWDAFHVHNDIRQRYVGAFNNPKIVQSVNADPKLYGVSERCKHKSKAYFNQVLIDLSRISKLEDYLHGDYSILKAQNYVLKIELIRVRNAIYHNNLYKYETCYF